MSFYLSNTSLMGPAVPNWLEELCQRLIDNEKSLKVVELTHYRLDDVFSRVFAKAFAENRVVDTLILSCFSIVDDGAYAIGSVLEKNKFIEKLQLRDLRNAREVTIFFESVSKNTSIKELSIRHAIIDSNCAAAVAQSLLLNKQLQEVRFVDSTISTDSMREICRNIKENQSIQRVYFVNCEIDVDGADSIADMVKFSSHITELYLCENEIGSEGVSRLSIGMRSNMSIHTLDLRSNSIDENGAMAIQGMITSCKGLVALHLGSNQLGNVGVAAIARALRQPFRKLERIDLNDNEIDDLGVASIASMLKFNRSLLEVNLSINSISDQGADEISIALERNTTLRWLSLRRNLINDEGAECMAYRLPNMKGLKELYLSKNNISVRGCCALLKGLRDNVELEYLHIEDKVSEPVAKEIFHWIRLNKAGRRIFRQINIPDPLWPKVYSRISFDNDVLFHFLSEKPDVISPVNKKRRFPQALVESISATCC